MIGRLRPAPLDCTAGTPSKAGAVVSVVSAVPGRSDLVS